MREGIQSPKGFEAMRTQMEATLSIAAAAVAMSAMVACGPAAPAKAPTGEAFAGAASGPSAQKLSAAPPPPTEAECRERASQPLPAPPEAASDVKLQYDAFFLAQHETFRCCFDALYAPKMPRTDGQ